MDNSISFRPLARFDLALLQRWFSASHVARWWNEPTDPASLLAKYGPRIDGAEPTHVFVIEYLGRPVGWVQWYRWADYPEHAGQLGADPQEAGIDLAIGETDAVGLGLGPIVIYQFLERMIFVDPAVTAVVTDPAEENTRSLRAFEKAGFTATHTVTLPGENFRRKVIRLARPVRSGEKVD
jgi:RimJ/RimL family protein N-acetyltransferase